MAMAAMEKAHSHDPDNLDITLAYGSACLDASQVSTNLKMKTERAQMALNIYDRAVLQNPLDVVSVFGLGRARAVMAELHPESMEPCAFLECFRQAVTLRPNGVRYNLYLARGLAYCHQEEELKLVVKRLTYIYPPSLNQLSREAYWSPALNPSAKEGLARAIQQNVLPRQAHQAMAALLVKEGDLPLAIQHYSRSLTFLQFENAAHNYIYLGSLFLKNKQAKEASDEFIYALSKTQFLEKDMERIFHIYRQEKLLEHFAPFYARVVEDFFVSSRLKILVGRSLFELKNWDGALAVFEELVTQDENGEAWYWLARIAGEKKDWSAMELRIQKATILDPENSQYHLMFSQVLQRLEKYERAEREASLAIHSGAKSSPWLHNHRAYVRWSRSNYEGALEDWQTAIRLKPDRPSFYAQAGRACEKLGRQEQAKKYFRKSYELDPGNPTYQKLAGCDM